MKGTSTFKVRGLKAPHLLALEASKVLGLNSSISLEQAKLNI